MFFVCACVWCDDPAVLENSGGDDTVQQTHFLHYNAKMQWNGQPHFSSFWSVMCSILFCQCRRTFFNLPSLCRDVRGCKGAFTPCRDAKQGGARRHTGLIGLKPGKSTDAFSPSHEFASHRQQMGPRAISPRKLVRSGTINCIPLGGACFLTTNSNQWEFSCFWNSPPELSMF